MKSRPGPRVWACNILWQITQGKRHLQNVLEEEFKVPADARDKAFCHNLLYLTLRNWLCLRFVLSRVCKINRLQNKLFNLLLLATAELKLMRTPDYAVVNDWVNASRELGLSRASGLVNGVLRGLTRMPELPEIPANNQVEYLSIKYSHPAWLVNMWLEQFGLQHTQAWLQACQQQPQLSIRVNTLKTSPQQLMDYLAPHAGNIKAHELHPWSLVISRPVQPLPGFREGLWQGQDAGATALTQLLGVKPGHRVLDMCAGTGGKSGHLAQLMQNQGELLALEISQGRAAAWQENMRRLGVNNARLLNIDATQLQMDNSFDCILLDAPCSGLGTTGRRPDLRLRRQPADVAALADVQKKLLASASAALKPGGKLLYATCSSALAENNDNISWLLAAFPQMRVDWEQAGPLLTNDNFWQTYPKPMGCDGFFAARLVKE